MITLSAIIAGVLVIFIIGWLCERYSPLIAIGGVMLTGAIWKMLS